LNESCAFKNEIPLPSFKSGEHSGWVGGYLKFMWATL